MKKLFLTAAIFLLALLCSCAKSESITDTTNGTDSTEESSALSDTESTMIESSSETEMGETTEETGTWANLQYSEDMDWLEFVVCNAFQKYPEELEPEDFQRIKRVSITLYNDISNEYYSEINSIRIYIENDNETFSYCQPIGQDNFSFPERLDFSYIKDCHQLSRLDVQFTILETEPFYEIDWESISELYNLRTLKIRFETHEGVYDTTFAEINDLSFVDNMQRLRWVEIAGFDLPTDISSLFKIETVFLIGCNITEESFQNLSSYDKLPKTLFLTGNQISDASELIAMQKADGSEILVLDLTDNPLQRP